MKCILKEFILTCPTLPLPSTSNDSIWSHFSREENWICSHIQGSWCTYVKSCPLDNCLDCCGHTRNSVFIPGPWLLFMALLAILSGIQSAVFCTMPWVFAWRDWLVIMAIPQATVHVSGHLYHWWTVVDGCLSLGAEDVLSMCLGSSVHSGMRVC